MVLPHSVCNNHNTAFYISKLFKLSNLISRPTYRLVGATCSCGLIVPVSERKCVPWQLFVRSSGDHLCCLPYCPDPVNPISSVPGATGSQPGSRGAPAPSSASKPLHSGSDRSSDYHRFPQEILIQLFLKGPFTVGIFRKSANARVVKEMREKLDSELEVSPAVFLRRLGSVRSVCGLHPPLLERAARSCPRELQCIASPCSCRLHLRNRSQGLSVCSLTADQNV